MFLFLFLFVFFVYFCILDGVVRGGMGSVRWEELSEMGVIEWNWLIRVELVD